MRRTSLGSSTRRGPIYPSRYCAACLGCLAAATTLGASGHRRGGAAKKTPSSPRRSARSTSAAGDPRLPTGARRVAPRPRDRLRTQERVARLMREAGFLRGSAGAVREDAPPGQTRAPCRPPISSDTSSPPRRRIACGWPTSLTSENRRRLPLFGLHPRRLLLPQVGRLVDGVPPPPHRTGDRRPGDGRLETQTRCGVDPHTDRGLQYTALSFGRRLEEVGIAPSMGRTGSALNNAPWPRASSPRSRRSSWLFATASLPEKQPGWRSLSTSRGSTAG